MAELELRRFRSWEPETIQPRAWWVIVRYGVRRMFRTWYLALLAVLALIWAVVWIGSTFSAFANPTYNAQIEGVEPAAAAAAIGIVPAVVFCLFLGGPMFSEDLRFNAPLFYFSRPVPHSHYFWGRAAHLAGTLVAVAWVPLLIVGIGLITIGAPNSAVPDHISDLEDYQRNFEYYFVDEFGSPEAARDWHVARWEATHIDTVPDALYAVTVVLVGMLALLAFLGSLTLMISAYTARAWHAALGLVASVNGLGFVGAIAEQGSKTALGKLTGPYGWMDLLLFVPLRMRFSEEANGFARGRWDDVRIEHGVQAIALGYILVLVLSALFLYVARRRVQQAGVSA